jgi:hypothetical protein
MRRCVAVVIEVAHQLLRGVVTAIAARGAASAVAIDQTVTPTALAALALGVSPRPNREQPQVSLARSVKSSAMRAVCLATVASISLTVRAQQSTLRFVVNTLPSEAQHRAIFLDEASVTMLDGLVMVRIVENLYAPQEVNNEFRSTAQEEAYDCVGLFSYRRSVSAFEQANAEGKTVWKNAYENWKTEPLLKSKKLLPGSMGRIVLDQVCWLAQQRR